MTIVEEEIIYWRTLLLIYIIGILMVRSIAHIKDVIVD